MRDLPARRWLLAAYVVIFVALRWMLAIDGFWNSVALSSIVAIGLLMVAVAWQSS